MIKNIQVYQFSISKKFRYIHQFNMIKKMNDMSHCINVIQHDATLVSLKKKQADSISEMYVFNSQIKMTTSL